MFWYYSRVRRIEKGKEKRENEKKERENVLGYLAHQQAHSHQPMSLLSGCSTSNKWKITDMTVNFSYAVICLLY
jgi:hypothetical protein